jgi:Protein of unknown function (DUF1488)
VVADIGVGVAATGEIHVIDFPNLSRSYDVTRHVVRFWGHDSAIEASFFIDEDALAHSRGFGPMNQAS